MGDNCGVTDAELSLWEQLVHGLIGEEVIIERHGDALRQHFARLRHTRNRECKQCLSLLVVCDHNIRCVRLVKKMHDALWRVAGRNGHDGSPGSQ